MTRREYQQQRLKTREETVFNITGRIVLLMLFIIFAIALILPVETWRW